MLHELVLPGLSINQSLVVASYGVMILVYLWRFRDIIAQSQFLLLLIALGLLGTSAGLDLLLPHFTGKFLLEDGSKFLGISTWLAYCATICADALRGAFSDSAAQVDAGRSASGERLWFPTGSGSREPEARRAAIPLSRDR